MPFLKRKKFFTQNCLSYSTLTNGLYYTYLYLYLTSSYKEIPSANRNLTINKTNFYSTILLVCTVFCFLFQIICISLNIFFKTLRVLFHYYHFYSESTFIYYFLGTNFTDYVEYQFCPYLLIKCIFRNRPKYRLVHRFCITLSTGIFISHDFFQ